MNKYRNKKTQIGMYVFDSISESKRYKELALLEQAGQIKGLELQPKFLLQEGFKKNGKTFRKKMIDMLNYDDIKVTNKTTEIKKMKPVQGKRIKKIAPIKETKDEVIIKEKPKKTKKKVKKDNK